MCLHEHYLVVGLFITNVKEVMFSPLSVCFFSRIMQKVLHQFVPNLVGEWSQEKTQEGIFKITFLNIVRESEHFGLSRGMRSTESE